MFLKLGPASLSLSSVKFGKGGYAVFRNEHHILSSAIFYFCSAVFVLKVLTVTFDNTNFRDFLPTHSLFVDSWRARLGNEGKGCKTLSHVKRTLGSKP